jgi:acetylglutamate kinase
MITDTLNVIKIGGNVIDDEKALSQFLKDFSYIRGPKILVHGGGKLATQLSEDLGIKTQMIDGRRVTDAPTLKVVSMVYAGWINKTLVAQLQSIGCNAIGLSGADANCIPARRRPAQPVDYGYVGDVSPISINTDFLTSLLSQNITPVFSAITHNNQGTLLNSNADTIASSLAIALRQTMQVRLIFCFEKNGILSDPNNDNSIIHELSRSLYEEYKAQGIISAGMIPKIDNAYKALLSGVKEVIVKHAHHLNSGGGTIIRLSMKEEE